MRRGVARVLRTAARPRSPDAHFSGALKGRSLLQQSRPLSDVVRKLVALVKCTFWVIATSYIYASWSTSFQRTKMQTALTSQYPYEHGEKSSTKYSQTRPSNTVTWSFTAIKRASLQGCRDGSTATRHPARHRLNQGKGESCRRLRRSGRKSGKTRRPFMKKVSTKQAQSEHTATSTGRIRHPHRQRHLREDGAETRMPRLTTRAPASPGGWRDAQWPLASRETQSPVGCPWPGPPSERPSSLALPARWPRRRPCRRACLPLQNGPLSLEAGQDFLAVWTVPKRGFHHVFPAQAVLSFLRL